MDTVQTAYGVHVPTISAANGQCTVCGLTSDDGRAEHDTSGRSHTVVVDPAYMGSGTDGDPWVLASWDVARCWCATPWHHAHGTV